MNVMFFIDYKKLLRNKAQLQTNLIAKFIKKNIL